MSRKWLVNILKVLLVTLLAFAIVKQVFLVDDFKQTWNFFRSNISNNAGWFAIIVFLLMLLNWSLESEKWRLLISHIEQISFITAFKAILCGITLGMVTPNRIGEYGGRYFYLKKSGIIQTITVTLIGSFSQIIATLFFGLLGMMFYTVMFNQQSSYVNLVIYFFSLFSLLILILSFFNLRWLYNLIRELKRMKKIHHYFDVIATYNTRSFLKLLLLSIIRYMIFSLQYLLLLKLFGVGGNMFNQFIMITLIFLVQTIIPSFAIAELGIRGNVALFFLGSLSSNHLAIWSAASSIWLVNLVIPSIIGGVLLLNLKLKTTE